MLRWRVPSCRWWSISGPTGAGRAHAMAPGFERAAAEMKTRARFAKVDTEAAPNIAGRYGIRSIPTLILFKQGKEAARVSGAMDARGILDWGQTTLQA